LFIQILDYNEGTIVSGGHEDDLLFIESFIRINSEDSLIALGVAIVVDESQLPVIVIP
jgi:hypothetical protein